jgi:hypothetical protein
MGYFKLDNCDDMKLSLHDRLKNLVSGLNNNTLGSRIEKDTIMLEKGINLIKSDKGSSVVTREDIAMLNNIIVEVIGLPTNGSLGNLFNSLGVVSENSTDEKNPC